METPFFYGTFTQVGAYFPTGMKPVNLLADPSYVRAWPGGCGYAKMGSNYAPTQWVEVSVYCNKVKIMRSLLVNGCCE